MLRFQPSWVLQSFGNEKIESLYFPYSPRAESLLWFKRVGHALLVHDPVPAGQVGLSAILANDSENLAESNRRLATRSMKKPVALELNPFRNWLDNPFTREQLDYLFFWREAGFEIEPVSQRCLILHAVGEVINCLCGFAGVKEISPMPPDDLIGYFLKAQQAKIFSRKGKIRIFDSVERAAVNLEAFCALVIILSFDEKPVKGFLPEEFFQAWLNGDGDLERARTEIERHRSPVTVSWGSPAGRRFEELVPLLQGCNQGVFCWSGEHLSPRYYEEHLVEPIKSAFREVCSRLELYVKGVDRQEEAYDFLLVLKR